MPKILTLKKSINNNSKNQKAITQFFKTVPCSQQTHSPIKHEESVETNAEIKLCKRKAFSPMKEEQLNVDKNGVDSLIFDNVLKKCKVDDSCKVLSKESKNTTQKPNCVNIKSPNEKHVLKRLFVDSDISCVNYNTEQNKLLSQLTSSLENISKSELSQNSKNAQSHVKEEYHMLDITVNKNEGVENNVHNVIDSSTCYKSPMKTLKAAICVSPKSTEIRTQIFDDCSPSKKGSTDKVLECSENDVHIFDDWELNVIEDTKEDLDLTAIQRCEVLSVKRHNYKIELKLKNNKDSIGTCYVDGIWLNTPLEVGETISVLGSRDSSGCFNVNNTAGLLVLRPDHLISSTSVVAGVYCKRKAVLQERWRGIDSSNTAMTIGILIHELVQKALTHYIINASELDKEANKIIKDSIQMLYDAGITETEAHSNMQMYIQPLANFMQTYVKKNTKPLQNEKGKWNGKIEKVLDIEENVCCPQLGLKGKIDATLQVSIHERGGRQTAIVPLELKSGRPSVSAEHRGQLVLYGMMLSLQRQEDPVTASQRGLLLYLKERIDLHEVSCGYPERRDLIMLRNDLVQHLAAGPQRIDTDELVDIEDASRTLQQSMPEPIHHHTACSKCPYLTLCSLHLWHTDGPTVSESHPLTKLRDEALGHLSLQHIQYFLHWTSLLKLEEKGQLITSPLHAFWSESPEKRAKSGVCAVNLKLKSVSNTGDRFSHVFLRQSNNEEHMLNDAKPIKGPQEGEFSIVSIENRPWIAAGVVSLSNINELHIVLERDLSRRLHENTLFHVDTYESFATTIQNLTNLGVLMENSDRALRLRSLIIDKVSPEFVPKLPREVGRLGTKLMRSLNIEQQRAVLKALACEQYVLLKGLPGTGKTQTISVLIQMLVRLKQRVLVTAHTHSAVDTVLNRLPDSLRVLRLGNASRVAPGLISRCEHTLIQKCHTTEQLEKLYNSMDVVGVTCLGAGHPMLARTTFDVCIVDEATQVLQCTVLRPLFASKRFVLVGDPEQLPPVVRSKSARRLGMEDSLFHRLMKDDATCTLRLQYRMNQALVEVANKVAYNNSLKCADQRVSQAKLKIDIQKITLDSKDTTWLAAACSPEFENAAIFLNTIISPAKRSTNQKVFINGDEACVVMELVETLKQGGVLASDIGIIAPYRDQVSLLRRAFSGKDVEVSTVDQFQGRDKSVIIYSCTKQVENEERRPKEGEVLNDQRRLAVSVTRAKHKLIVIGNLAALKPYNVLLKLIHSCKTITLIEDIVIKLSKKYEAFFM